MKPILIITFVIFSLSLYAQNDMPKRKAFKLEMAADEMHQYTMDIAESPYFIKEKIIQLYCNEKVFVECEIKADTISTMKVVEKNTNPERTIIIEFNQNAENRKDIQTNLIVKNPFNKKLNYDAVMYTPTRQQWQRTSIIAILPDLLGYEIWPHAIITLVLDNWRFE